MRTDDTIIAISSAAGSGARAIVRLSGPRALELGEQVFQAGAPLSQNGGFRCVNGIVTTGTVPNGGTVPLELPAVAYVFRAPRSFTRQDVLELHIPGSPHAAAGVVAAMIDLGARQAHAGEFTARAFFSGRLDLSAAQAVADVIDAAQEVQLRQAVQAMGGRIARLCRQAADELADVLAATEASIDLEQEQIELDAPADLSCRLRALAAGLQELADSAADMPERSHLPRAVLYGLPNAGKSSLLNALSGGERAIVSPVAGTTRDVLGQTIVLGGNLVLLQDAAGVGQRHDELTRSADDAAKNAVASADLVLLVVDAAAPAPSAVAKLRDDVQALSAAPMLVLASKADLVDSSERAHGVFEHDNGDRHLCVSALTGQGMDALRTAMSDALHLQANRDGQTIGLHRRQKRHFQQAAVAAVAAAEIFDCSSRVADQAELAAVELRQALAELGAISGQVVTEDILGRIFQRFCVGK